MMGDVESIPYGTPFSPYHLLTLSPFHILAASLFAPIPDSFIQIISQKLSQLSGRRRPFRAKNILQTIVFTNQSPSLLLTYSLYNPLTSYPPDKSPHTILNYSY